MSRSAPLAPALTQREIVVEVRFPASIAPEEFPAMARDFEVGARRAWAKANICPPANACRMCGATVAWSPLCSGCCGLLERVREAVRALPGGRGSHTDICQRLEHVRGGREDSRRLDVALRELELHGEVAVYGRDRALVAVRSEVA